MFDVRVFEDELALEYRSQELSAEVLALIDKWLEDGVFDDSEKEQAVQIELNLRHACEQAFNSSEGDLERAATNLPGLTSLAGLWVVLGSLVLALEINQQSGAVGQSAQPIISSEAFLSSLKAVGSVEAVPIHDYLFPWVAASIISNSNQDVAARWTAVINNIAQAQPQFVSAVLAKLEGRGRPSSVKKLGTMSDFLAGRENHRDRDHRKSYKKYHSRLSAGFRDQGFLRFQGDFSDERGKEVMLTFGDRAMAISVEGGQVVEIPSSEVRFISVGTRTERLHSGFSHADYYFWTFDIVRSSGARWRLKKLIGTGQLDSNPMREHLTALAEEISDYYKVVAAGTQEVSESGYRTRVSYGVWF